ncbi:U3 small nucleolar RNA-associated protein 4 homolog isoform X2 [Tachypleus tridentatus]|uniref:U3 small nucleolar RNA-associated protein 4 homolog isoform X2 n=2 Tax=Tachypleus tridentatus TaxID=6853 RepID=UPI003FD0ABB2
MNKQKFRIHHINFFQPEAKSIHCVAFENNTKKLAVARSDFSIEIWNLSNTHFLESVIPGDPSSSVEAVVWCNGRLFSCGLQGYISEYDLLRLVPKYSVPVTSGPAWCQGFNERKSLLAVGTEDGYVCLFHVQDDGVDFEKTFDRQEGRILCLAWHKSGDILVTGSIDTIRIWNVHTGHAKDRIIVGRLERNTETIVWCLAVTSDLTIISGDSWGRTSFWDAETGTLEMDENSVYTSGVDPIVIQFTRVPTQRVQREGRLQWVRSMQRVLHTHDVRSLAVAGEFLVTGGVDTNLVLSKYPPKICLKYPPFIQSQLTHIAHAARCILLQYSRKLELWRLGDTTGENGEDGDVLPLSSNVKKLIELKIKESDILVCCAISSTAKWLAYSTTEQLRLFRICLEEPNSPSLKKIRSLPSICLPAHQLVFGPDGDILVAATQEGSLQVLELHHTESIMCHSMPIPKEHNSSVIHIMTITTSGRHLVTANIAGYINVYNLKEYKFLYSLPHYVCPPTALGVNSLMKNIVVIYSDQRLVEYSLEKQEYTAWMRQMQKDRVSLGLSRYSPITEVSFDPNNKSLIILHDDSSVFLLDKSCMLVEKHTKQTRSVHEKDINHQISPEVKGRVNKLVRKCTKFKHLLSFNNLENDEFVAVEITPSQILDKLPPLLKQKKFGT